MFQDLDNPSKYDDATLRVDGDIICYFASSAADGRVYKVEVPSVVKDNYHEFKYKKDAVAFCVEHNIDVATIELDFEPEPETHALHTCKLAIQKLQELAPGAAMVIYLTGRENYRKQIDPNYKAHRKASRTPEHLAACKQYMLSHWNAVLVEGLEADDLMGAGQFSDIAEGRMSIICTIDKDLDTIPGLHYNWNKDKMYDVSIMDADNFFYQQALQGDATDNIPGLPGIGPAKASKWLEPLYEDGNVPSDTDLYFRCMELYFTKYPRANEAELVEDWMDRVMDAFRITAQLVWIQRVEHETWVAPC